MTDTATKAPVADDVTEAAQTKAEDTTATTAADQAQGESQEDTAAPKDEAAQTKANAPARKAEGTPPEDTSDEDESEGDEEFPAAARTALAKVRREAKSLRERLRAAEAKALRAEVAADMGIPAALADRLTGDTAEAMRADAEGLLDALGIRPVNTPPGMPRESTPTPAPSDDRPASLDDLAARMYAR